MLIKEEILKILHNSTQGMTARDLAKQLGISKTETNSILYLMENKIISKSSTIPPCWRTKPLHEQLSQILEAYDNEGRTAVELSNELCISKNAVNSTLYEFEGKFFHKMRITDRNGSNIEFIQKKTGYVIKICVNRISKNNFS